MEAPDLDGLAPEAFVVDKRWRVERSTGVREAAPVIQLQAQRDTLAASTHKNGVPLCVHKGAVDPRPRVCVHAWTQREDECPTVAEEQFRALPRRRAESSEDVFVLILHNNDRRTLVLKS